MKQLKISPILNCHDLCFSLQWPGPTVATVLLCSALNIYQLLQNRQGILNASLCRQVHILPKPQLFICVCCIGPQIECLTYQQLFSS